MVNLGGCGSHCFTNSIPTMVSVIPTTMKIMGQRGHHQGPPAPWAAPYSTYARRDAGSATSPSPPRPAWRGTASATTTPGEKMENQRKLMGFYGFCRCGIYMKVWLMNWDFTWESASLCQRVSDVLWWLKAVILGFSLRYQLTATVPSRWDNQLQSPLQEIIVQMS
jgi:hypothetical protein